MLSEECMTFVPKNLNGIETSLNQPYSIKKNINTEVDARIFVVFWALNEQSPLIA